MNPSRIILLVIAILGMIVLGSSAYTVRETEVVILTQFGRQIGTPVTESGLHWKLPFIQSVNRIEKRLLEWDGPVSEMPTEDKTYISVEAFARWRIHDPAIYFVSLRDERSAQSRLDDIIGSEIRIAVARHELIEIVRSDKARKMVDAVDKDFAGKAAELPTIKRGRREIERDILKEAAPKVKSLGIELLDVRLKRVNYNTQVVERIHQRMISERLQIAQGYRSKGEGEALRITGKRDRDLREIESTAYRKVQEIQGAADAEATRIYAEAFNKSPQAVEFYGFVKTMETYKKILLGETSIVLSTDGDLFRLLKSAKPVAAETAPSSLTPARAVAPAAGPIAPVVPVVP
ncbi:protein HflC [Verrucomicrobiota bacterium]|nr:protein HflC [Verrucomicrobiota bacterium]